MPLWIATRVRFEVELSVTRPHIAALVRDGPVLSLGVEALNRRLRVCEYYCGSGIAACVYWGSCCMSVVYLLVVFVSLYVLCRHSWGT